MFFLYRKFYNSILKSDLYVSGLSCEVRLVQKSSSDSSPADSWELISWCVGCQGSQVGLPQGSERSRFPPGPHITVCELLQTCFLSFLFNFLQKHFRCLISFHWTHINYHIHKHLNKTKVLLIMQSYGWILDII